MNDKKNTTELNKITTILQELRDMKDSHKMQPMSEIRSLYNTICDRLDVLQSKLLNGNDARKI